MNSHIWCSSCDCIRPVAFGQMDGDDITGRFTDAVDVMCSKCHLVIATMYNPKQPPSQRDAPE